MSSKCCCHCKSKSTYEDAEKRAAKIEADESKKRRKNRKIWLSKQYLPVEAAITAVDGAFLGAVRGVILSLVYNTVCHHRSSEAFVYAVMGAAIVPQTVQTILSSTGGYQPLIRSFIVGGTLEHVRNLAVLKGVSEGISCVMRRLGSKEDIHAKMVTSFGSGVALSLASGMRGPDVISTGVMLALVNGGIFKLREKSLQRKAEEEVLTRSRGMFLSIGFGLD